MNRSGRRLTTRRVGSILLLYQGVEHPSDVEWDECLTLLIRCYNFSEMGAACNHLGLAHAEREQVEKNLAEMRSIVSNAPPP